ncbi:MAG: L-aspartate oxidase [Actinobacteria bacterium]|nr:L-aspartate oxidase [Actinomycetota bacterium]
MTGPASPPATPTFAVPGRIDSDVAIIGAGLAGLFASLHLPATAEVVIVDKGGMDSGSGSSPWAQGGVAVAVGPDDTPELHAQDTLRAADGLADPAAVTVLTHEGPQRLEQLIAFGAQFDRDASGQLHLAREGAQSVARSVHCADATGAEMMRALRVAASDRVARLEGSAVALARPRRGDVSGVWVLADGELVLVRARAVLLATGGCGGLFAATTNSDHATGDGVALAWRAGAAVRDLEFVQFHPTGLAVGGAKRLLLTEALRGAGATLIGEDGERFMADVHPDAELAPRHVVAKAMLERDDRVWLDARHLGARVLEAEFPTVLRGAREHGFDLTTEPVPVTPAAHYQVGGVRTDLDGRTSLNGLWAAGEVASTGAHGANRMAGNSLLEALVFGARAAESIGASLDAPLAEPGLEPTFAAATLAPGDLAEQRAALRQAMWRGCGPIRDAASLTACAAAVGEIAGELGPPSADSDHLELIHALTTASLMVRAAALRTESRGGHWREDHPARELAWDDVHIEWIDTTA